MIQLREYQQAAIDSLFNWWAAGRIGEDPLISIPTGGGKTIIFAALIQRLLTEYPGVSVLILAHRKELISQAEDKLLSVWPQAPVGVYAASLNRREIRPITIASRDTIARVIDDVGQFTFVIIDEAHRISNKDEGQYRTMIGKLRAQYEHLVVIGFTATPFRLGQGRIYGEGKPFAGLAYKIGMLELIKQGYLSALTSIVPKAGQIDTTGVKTVAGDYDEKQLENRATAEGIIESAVDEWLETAFQRGRKASVFFCVSVKHAELTRDEIRRRGIDCETVHGKCSNSERERVLNGFDRGDFPALTNVSVLIEGWDSPRVDCIVMMRPTKSSALYCQQVGRGLRLFPNKQDCLVLDFGGNIELLGPVDQADEKEPKPKKRKPCPECQFSNEPDAVVCAKCGALLNQAAPYRRCGEWDESVGAFIGGCGHKNPTAAIECEECGKLFVRHNAQAKHGGLISTEHAYEDFPVESVRWSVNTSRTSGGTYLRLAFTSGLFEVFYKNLFIGYGGYAGTKAIKEWAMLTENGSTPADAYEAVDLLDDGEESIRSISGITVDIASRWKDIVRFSFAVTEELTHE